MAIQRLSSNPTAPLSTLPVEQLHQENEVETRTDSIARSAIALASLSRVGRQLFYNNHSVTLPEPSRPLPRSVETSSEDTLHFDYFIFILNHPHCFDPLNTVRGYVNAIHEASIHDNSAQRHFILEQFEVNRDHLELAASAVLSNERDRHVFKHLMDELSGFDRQHYQIT